MDPHPYPRTAGENCRLPPPDLLVLTGDIFDEFTEPEELEKHSAACSARSTRLWANTTCWAIDLFHHWREPSSRPCGLGAGLGQSGRTPAEDTGVMLPCGVRIVGRKKTICIRMASVLLPPS